MCGNTDNLQSDEQKDEVSNGLASSTAGGSTFTPDSIRKLLDMMRFLLNQLQGGGRRRRSADGAVVKTETPENVSDPETMYRLCHEAIISKGFSSINRWQKITEFLNFGFKVLENLNG